jgi:hypothetical protein
VLALVEKARSLWVRDSSGPWLHRVAHHVATRVRSSAARQSELERRAAATRPTLVSERGDWEVGARSSQLAARAGRHPPARQRKCGVATTWPKSEARRGLTSAERNNRAGAAGRGAAGRAHSGGRMPMNEESSVAFVLDVGQAQNREGHFR